MEIFYSASTVAGRKAAASASDPFGSSPSIIVHPMVLDTSTEYSPSFEMVDDWSLLAFFYPPFPSFPYGPFGLQQMAVLFIS